MKSVENIVFPIARQYITSIPSFFQSLASFNLDFADMHIRYMSSVTISDVMDSVSLNMTTSIECKGCKTGIDFSDTENIIPLVKKHFVI